MEYLFYFANIAFCIWVIFFGGAEELENTIVGYFEFGLVAGKASLIRASAWVSLVLQVVFIFLK